MKDYPAGGTERLVRVRALPVMTEPVLGKP